MNLKKSVAAIGNQIPYHSDQARRVAAKGMGAQGDASCTRRMQPMIERMGVAAACVLLQSKPEFALARDSMT